MYRWVSYLRNWSFISIWSDFYKKKQRQQEDEEARMRRVMNMKMMDVMGTNGGNSANGRLKVSMFLGKIN